MLSRPVAHPVAMFACSLCAVVATSAYGAGLPLSWTNVEQTAPSPMSRHVAIVDDRRDGMVVYGGRTPGNEAAGIWRLDLATDRWVAGRPSQGPPDDPLSQGAAYDSRHDRMLTYGGSRYAGAQSISWFSEVSLATLAPAVTIGPPNAAGVYPGGATVLVDSLRQLAYACSVTALGKLDLTTGAVTPMAVTGVAQYFQTEGPAVVYDGPRDRLVGLTIANQIATVALGASPAWGSLTASGMAPPNLVGPVVHDALREQLLLVRGDMSVWALSLSGAPAWSQLSNGAGGPSPRTGYTVVRDAKRDRLLLFGSTTEDDLWQFDLTSETWRRLNPGTVPNVTAYDHTCTRAPSLDAALLFGPLSPAGIPENAVLRYPLDGLHGFSILPTTGIAPAARSKHAAAFDPVRNRLLVFGGDARMGTQTATLPDVHALSLDGPFAWSTLPLSGGPGGRSKPLMQYDAAGDRLLVFGGTSTDGQNHADLWELPLSGSPAWHLLDAGAGLPAMWGSEYAALVLDGPGHRLVLLGTPLDSIAVTAWTFDLNAAPHWERLATEGTPPDALAGYGVEVDEYGRRILVLGGESATSLESFVDTRMALSLSGPATWTNLSIDGSSAPPSRSHFTLVRDPLRYRTLMIGGREARESTVPYRNDPTVTRWWLTEDVSAIAVASVGDGARTLSLTRLSLADGRALHWSGVLPGDGAARLDVFDVTGRRLGGIRLDAVRGAASGELTLRTRAHAGVCFVRLTQGDAWVTRRLAVLP